jgi:alkanesulfonate monooxygenase SsuD/methylene tetrahydromethanopterin reductase-like flavin-dependent oxidoreductase (luciferase family)
MAEKPSGRSSVKIERRIGVKFGVHYAGSYQKAKLVDFAKRCEEMGLDSLRFREGSLGDDPLVPLAAAATACNLMLGTGVLIMPFRNPVLTARSIATLDELSGRRVVLGVGVGGERQREFDAYGVERRERGPRTNESLELMLRLWTEQEVRTAAGRCSVRQARAAPGVSLSRDLLGYSLSACP